MDFWTLFDWVAACLVISSMVYLTFILTVPQWMAGARRGETVSLIPERGGRKYPLWVQIALLILGIGLLVLLLVFLWKPVLTFSNSVLQALKIVGLVLYFLGFIFLLWSRQSLGKNWGLSTSAAAKLYQDHELIQTGPYALVRHPMYFGALVFMVGMLLLYPNWVTLILLISFISSFWMRTQREEHALAERFGKEWQDYKSRTKFIIPFVV